MKAAQNRRFPVLAALAVTLVTLAGAPSSRSEDTVSGLPSRNAADYDVAAARAALDTARAALAALVPAGTDAATAPGSGGAGTPARPDAAAVAAAEARVTAAQTRLDEVTRNLERGRAYVRAQGARAGAVHGTSAGVKRGVDEAKAQAAEQGVREARAEFEAGIGREIETSAARAALGQVLAAKAAELRAAVPGELSTRVAATAPDGAAALATEGASAFARQVHDRNAAATTAAAEAEGVSAGTARARSQAVSRSAEGSRAPIQARFYDPASLRTTVLENRAEIRSRIFEDVAAAPAFDYRTMANYRPDRAFPHPELSFAFREAYDASYLAAAAPAYESSRAEALPRLVAAQKFWELERLRRLPRGPELARREREQRDSFAATYRAGLDAAYAETLARLDRELTERVRTESETRAYDANLEPFTREEIDARVAAEGVRLASAFEPRVTGVALADADGDSVFAPGEGASLAVSIQNFGEVPQSEDVKVTLRPLTDGVVVDLAEDALVQLPGRSATTVRKTAPFLVIANAAVASTQRLAVQVLLGGTRIFEQEVSMAVGHPFTVARITGPAAMAAGEAAAVTVRVRNSSSKPKAAPIRVSLVEDAGAYSPESSAGVEISEDLAPGAERDVTLGLVPRAEGSFEGLSVRAQVHMGDWLLGQGGSRLGSATWRHRFETDTSALVVVASEEEGRMARRMIFERGEKYRILDLRAESLTAETLRPYTAARLPVFFLSLRGATQGRMLGILRSRMLQDAVASGAQVLMVLPERHALAEGEFPSRFRALPAAEPITEIRQGAFFFRDADRRVRSVPFTSQPGAIATATILPGVMGPLESFRLFAAIAAPFETKLRSLLRDGAAGQTASEARWRGAIFRDVAKEIADDQGLAMRNYDHRRELTRLNHLVVTASAATGADRCRLASLHALIKPVVDERVGFMDQVFWPFSRERALSNVLEPLGRIAAERACQQSRTGSRR